MLKAEGLNMRWIHKLPLRLRSLFRKDRVEKELTDELRFHLEKLIEGKVGRGMTPEEAHYAALRELGGVEQIKEECRDMRRVNYIEDFFEDLRYSLRQLRRNPGFTAVAVITLALGIGATAAVFTVVDRDLFRDPPYPQSERLVSWGVVAPIEDREFMLGKPYVELHQHTTPFESYTSWTPGVVGCDLTEQNPVRLNCARVESNFLATFRVTPMLGRDFSREDDRPGAPRVALITYGLWQRRFGTNPDAAGK